LQYLNRRPIYTFTTNISSLAKGKNSWLDITLMEFRLIIDRSSISFYIKIFEIKFIIGHEMVIWVGIELFLNLVWILVTDWYLEVILGLKWWWRKWAGMLVGAYRCIITSNSTLYMQLFILVVEKSWLVWINIRWYVLRMRLIVKLAIWWVCSLLCWLMITNNALCAIISLVSTY
jgi:hypothetical protein